MSRVNAVLAALGVLVVAGMAQAAPARAATVPAVYGFGANFAGELGDGTTTASLSPVLAGLPSPVRQVTTGLQMSAAVLTDGSLWVWGTNYLGQLGIGSVGGDYTTPVQVPGLSNVIQVALSGEGGGLAVESNGTLWAWGDNTYGELGNGTTTPSYSPVRVSSLSGIIQVASGGYDALALGSNGTVYAWGINGEGELGDGTTTSKSLPEPVLNGVIQIAAGPTVSFAVRANGTLLDWGSEGSGALGNGASSGFIDTPEQVGGLSNVRQVASDGFNALAVAGSSPGVYAWGDNTCGAVGDGTTTTRLTPVSIGLDGTVQVAVGDDFLFTDYSAAVRSDGTLWTWGCNSSGQLGYGATAAVLTPRQVTALTGVSQFAFGEATTSFLNPGAYGLAVAPRPVTAVPNLVGDTLTRAETVLTAAGLSVGTIASVVDCNHLGIVVSQSPAAGTTVFLGTAVSVRVGTRPPPPRLCQ